MRICIQMKLMILKIYYCELRSIISNFLTSSPFFFFLRSTQGGEITIYGLTETAKQVSSVGLHVDKNKHGYRLKRTQGRQDQTQHE